MTWTIRQRGDASAPILRDFECESCGFFEAVVDRDADFEPCPECAAPAPYRLSPPLVGMVLATAINTGKSDERPPAHVMLDTRDLADGMSPAEWHLREKQRNQDARRRWVRRQTS